MGHCLACRFESLAVTLLQVICISVICYSVIVAVAVAPIQLTQCTWVGAFSLSQVNDAQPHPTCTSYASRIHLCIGACVLQSNVWTHVATGNGRLQMRAHTHTMRTWYRFNWSRRFEQLDMGLDTYNCDPLTEFSTLPNDKNNSNYSSRVKCNCRSVTSDIG